MGKEGRETVQEREDRQRKDWGERRGDERHFPNFPKYRRISKDCATAANSTPDEKAGLRVTGEAKEADGRAESKSMLQRAPGED